jgi:hypothetical protein
VHHHTAELGSAVVARKIELCSFGARGAVDVRVFYEGRDSIFTG